MSSLFGASLSPVDGEWPFEEEPGVSLALSPRNYEVSPEARIIRVEESVLFIHPAVRDDGFSQSGWRFGLATLYFGASLAIG